MHIREDIGSDDIDIRVKYAGMFHRKKATPGRFMMRLRLPNGIIRSSDMRYIGTPSPLFTKQIANDFYSLY